ncbi:MAG: fluoride efflux transporter CrcB [Actinomycetota bacterium]|nr:fluoride efflux transporter CrcB [Actinomycetota bacterium]
MSILAWAGVALLGGVGAIARFLLDGFVGSHAASSFPLGTFAVNISGAFLLGIVTGLALTGDPLVLAGTATLGSYTTFSTWMLETQRLSEEGEVGRALANTLISLLVGFGAIAIGRTLGAQA